MGQQLTFFTDDELMRLLKERANELVRNLETGETIIAPVIVRGEDKVIKDGRARFVAMTWNINAVLNRTRRVYAYVGQLPDYAEEQK